MSARTIRFLFVDVFTDEPLAGNPLAVVPDAAVGRPSRIEVRVDGSEVAVWGRAVVVAVGRLRIQ